jgi:hypothetical protein
MSSIPKDPNWKKSRTYRDLCKNKAYTLKLKYGSINRQIYYTEKGSSVFKELVILEPKFDRKWSDMALRYLIWRYPHLVFWSHLKKSCSFLGSTDGHICKFEDKTLLKEVLLPNGYLCVKLNDDSFYPVHDLLMEMTLPDDMKAIYD